MARRYAAQKEELNDLQRSMNQYQNQSRDSMRKSTSSDNFQRQHQDSERTRSDYDRYSTRSSSGKARTRSINDYQDYDDRPRSRRRFKSRSSTGKRRSRSSREYDSESDDGERRMKQKDVLAAVNISIDESSKSAAAISGQSSKNGTENSKTINSEAGGSDVTRKTVTHAYVMAPTKSVSEEEKKRPIWKYAFYACLVILGSIIGVVAYVTYTKGQTSSGGKGVPLTTALHEGTDENRATRALLPTPATHPSDDKTSRKQTPPPTPATKKKVETTTNTKIEPTPSKTTEAYQLTTLKEPAKCLGSIYQHLIIPPSDDNRCDGKSAGTYMSIKDCSSYYICTGRGGAPWRSGLCPCQKIFDNATGKCVRQRDGFYVVPKDCSKFKRCILKNGKTIRGAYDCNPGLAFTLSDKIPTCRLKETVPECE